jgi:sugar O-acyltransferase (sialic acid O-acetyltransferase NeuD family)
MKTVIFGAGGLASVTWYILTHDSPHEVVGFTVDADYLREPERHGLPVVDFSTVEKRFPPDEHQMVLALGPVRVNRLREERCLDALRKGYTLGSYVSSRALTWPDLAIGGNVMIHDGVIIQPFATIGSNTILRSGCHISHHVKVGDHCFLAPCAVLGGNVSVGARSFIGLNAVIRSGLSIAEGCFIAAGAVVTTDTVADGVYRGAPARHMNRRASAMEDLR